VAPAPLLRLALGPAQADGLVLVSQRTHPTVPASAGFTYRFPTLEPALRDLLRP
jgi:NAD dependent epimerase/dehydratase family enzyme